MRSAQAQWGATNEDGAKVNRREGGQSVERGGEIAAKTVRATGPAITGQSLGDRRESSWLSRHDKEPTRGAAR